MSRFVLPLCVLAALLAPSRGSDAAAQTALRVGDRVERAIEIIGLQGQPRWRWRLARTDDEPVWISLETLDFVTDFSVVRTDGASTGVSTHHLGLSDYVRLGGRPGEYRLTLTFEPDSKPAGEFSLRVDRAAPTLPRERTRHAVERAIYERALARDGVSRAPAFRAMVLGRLIDALQNDRAWARLAELVDDAIALRVAAGEFYDAAQLLDERARAELALGRPAPAVDTLDAAARMWLRASDRDNAAARLAWSFAVCTRVADRVARARLVRAYGIAAQSEQPGFCFEAIAHALEEQEVAPEAVRAFDRASRAHAADGFGRSAALAADEVVRLIESAALVSSPEVTTVAPEQVGEALKRKMFEAMRERDADRCRVIGGWGSGLLERSGATSVAADLQLELGYVLQRFPDHEPIAAFRAARRLYATAENVAGEGRAMNEIALLLDRGGDVGAAIPLFERAFECACSSGDDELRHWTAFNLGHHFSLRSEWRKATDWFVRIGDLPPVGEGSTGFARFLRQVVASFRAADRPRDGLRFQAYIVRVYRARSMTRSLRRALVEFGDLALAAGKPVQAAFAFGEICATGRRNEPDRWTRRASAGLHQSIVRIAFAPH